MSRTETDSQIQGTFLQMPDGMGLTAKSKKVEGFKKYSTGNIVTNIIITMYGIRLVVDYQGDHLVNYIMSNHWVLHLQLICNRVCQL